MCLQYKRVEEQKSINCIKSKTTSTPIFSYYLPASGDFVCLQIMQGASALDLLSEPPPHFQFQMHSYARAVAKYHC